MLPDDIVFSDFDEPLLKIIIQLTWSTDTKSSLNALLNMIKFYLGNWSLKVLHS